MFEAAHVLPPYDLFGLVSLAAAVTGPAGVVGLYSVAAPECNAIEDEHRGFGAIVIPLKQRRENGDFRQASERDPDGPTPGAD
jgi:hypothetical protein